MEIETCPKNWVHFIRHLFRGKSFGRGMRSAEYWHQRADERHGNPPQSNQELLVVRDKVGRPQVSLG